MFLTTDELRQLTGCAWRNRQVVWLKANNWPHEVSATGRILVLREYFVARMSGIDSQRPTVHAHASHNFAAVR